MSVARLATTVASMWGLCAPLMAAEEVTSPMCGPLSLGFTMKQLGVTFEVDEVLKQTGYSPTGGTTMAGLKTCAERHGLHCACVRISLKALLPLLDAETYGILYQSNHFGVVCVSGKAMLYIDPMMKSQAVIQDSDLQKEYPILLVSTKALPMEGETAHPASVGVYAGLAGLAAMGVIIIARLRRRAMRRFADNV